MQRKQQLQWNAQDAAAAQAAAAATPVPVQASAPAEPAAPAPVPTAPGARPLLDQLGQLRDAGLLTPEEFEVQKQRLLAP